MKRIILAVLGALLLAVTGCSNGDKPAAPAAASQEAPNAKSSAVFLSIKPREAKRLIETRKDLLLIDVRTPPELKEGMVKGATLLPFWSVMQGPLDLPRDKAILLICAVGGRSYAAGQVLSRKGYKEVYNLSGGISAWKKAGLPLVF